MVLCYSGPVVLWYCGTVVLWYCGVVVLCLKTMRSQIQEQLSQNNVLTVVTVKLENLDRIFSLKQLQLHMPWYYGSIEKR